MSTKAQITTAVNGYITATVDTTDHRASMLELINELYPSVVNDSQSTETYTAKAGTNIEYSITIHKSGNSCRIKGTVHNTTTLSLFPQNVFTWEDTQYKPKSGVNDISFKAYFGNGSQITLFLSNNVLALTSSLPALGTYSFDYTFYVAQD